MLLPNVSLFRYDKLLLIHYVPNDTIIMTHLLDIIVTFKEMMCMLGHTFFGIPHRTSDTCDL